MKSKTRIYKFDEQGNLVSVKYSREPEVKIFKQGGAFKYSVSDSRTGKLLHAGSVGKLSECSYCHEKIVGRAVKLGVLSFHRHCYQRFCSWQKKNETETSFY